jgi:hypothetical protein
MWSSSRWPTRSTTRARSPGRAATPGSSSSTSASSATSPPAGLRRGCCFAAHDHHRVGGPVRQARPRARRHRDPARPGRRGRRRLDGRATGTPADRPDRHRHRVTTRVDRMGAGHGRAPRGGSPPVDRRGAAGRSRRRRRRVHAFRPATSTPSQRCSRRTARSWPSTIPRATTCSPSRPRASPGIGSATVNRRYSG